MAPKKDLGGGGSPLPTASGEKPIANSSGGQPTTVPVVPFGGEKPTGMPSGSPGAPSTATDRENSIVPVPGHGLPKPQSKPQPKPQHMADPLLPLKEGSPKSIPFFSPIHPNPS